MGTGFGFKSEIPWIPIYLAIVQSIILLPLFCVIFYLCKYIRPWQHRLVADREQVRHVFVVAHPEWQQLIRIMVALSY
jgi:hypothetical protein